MSESNFGTGQRVWVPDIYRQVRISETNPSLEEFANQTRKVLLGNSQPRLYLFTQREALELDVDAAIAVNKAISSELPTTIVDELEVLTSGIRIATRYSSRRFLTLQIADATLPQERQPILDAAYKSYGKLPSLFKNFCWEVEWGPIKDGVEVVALPSELEKFRPGVINLKPAHIKEQNR